MNTATPPQIGGQRHQGPGDVNWRGCRPIRQAEAAPLYFRNNVSGQFAELNSAVASPLHAAGVNE